MTKERLHKATTWIKENKKTVLTVGGITAATGVLAYLGISSIKAMDEQAKQIVADTIEDASDAVVHYDHYNPELTIIDNFEFFEDGAFTVGSAGKEVHEYIANNFRVKDLGAFGEALKKLAPNEFDDETVVSAILNATSAEFVDHALDEAETITEVAKEVIE